MDELNCPINTNDYATVPQLRPTPVSVKLTQTVVEVHQPRDLAAPDPEAADIQHIPEAVQVEVKETNV